MAPCKSGKEKNANGRCVKIKHCEDPNKEKNANGRCVKKCKSHQHRNAKGVCMPRDKPKPKTKAKASSLKKRIFSAELDLQGRELKYVKVPERKLHMSKSEKLKGRYATADLSDAEGKLRHVSSPGTRKRHMSETEHLEKKFKAADLALAKKKLRHIKTAERGSRKIKPKKKTERYRRAHLILAKRSLKKVKPGTRKMHTSRTKGYSQFDSLTPSPKGFFNNFKW